MNKDTAQRYFFEEHYDDILSYCAHWMKKSKHNPDVQDAASNTLLKVVKKWDSYDISKGSLKTWAIRIARNTMIDDFRKQKEYLTDDIEMLEQYMPKQSDPKNYGLLRNILDVCKDRSIDVTTYTPWFMKFLGFTYREMSAILKVDESTARKRAKRFAITLLEFQEETDSSN